MGEIQLSALISDGMVLQRETENCIWGYAEPKKYIRLFLGAYQTATETGEDGYFELTLPPMKAGGPWKLFISDGEECVTIRDILFGDVFLLGGQSNMELPLARVTERFGEELENTVKKEIRMFEVPKEYLFGGVREEIEKGCWIKAEADDLMLFSAVGYFAAKELYERECVPIGLLQTAVGGTPVKAWCSEQTVRALGYDVAELSECSRDGYPQRIEKEEIERENRWRNLAFVADDGEKRKGLVSVPDFFAGGELAHFYGGLRLHRTVVLPKEVDWQQEEATLYLGAVIDADVTYVNGTQIGETTYRYPPRIYPIPKGILHAGENEITVDMQIFREGGGFMPGKSYALCYGKNKEKRIDLTGEWKYEIIRQMEELPEMTFFQYKAAGLYQGMLYPIRKWRLKGCFFYQGESNTGRPETYEEEFAAMIADWRALWKMDQLPFFYVQLAGFADGKTQTEGTNWAKLREAQRRAQSVPSAWMVQAYDLGEYNDLHPLDKKRVGQRIATVAERMIYGKETACSNTELVQVCWGENEAILYFAPEGTTLHTISGEVVQGFEFLCEDGTHVAADARIKTASSGYETETLREMAGVVAKLPADKKVVGISYAWNDCPLDANIYNEAELPLVPFCAIRK